MKLLLQRTLNCNIEGPFWVESAYMDKELHGFMPLAKDSGSYCEPRFGPDGKAYWISEEQRVFCQNSPTPLTQRPTFKLAFGDSMVTLECQDEDSPYGLVQGGDIQLLDSSLTHLDPIPGSDHWLVSSLELLYRGPLNQLKSQGPTPARRFSAGPDHFYYAKGPQLLQQALVGGPPEPLFACSDGSLSFPLYTSRGILITQEDSAENHLWLVDPQTKQATSLWHARDEWIYACAAHPDGSSYSG